MESFDGLAILATNLRANLDEALTRRLDLIVDFPIPDATLPRGLGDRCLGRRIPRTADLDLDFCAGAFELSGSNIRSAVVSAAYLAAQEDRSVRTADLVPAYTRNTGSWVGSPWRPSSAVLRAATLTTGSRYHHAAHSEQPDHRLIVANVPYDGMRRSSQSAVLP